MKCLSRTTATLDGKFNYKFVGNISGEKYTYYAGDIRVIRKALLMKKFKNRSITKCF